MKKKLPLKYEMMLNYETVEEMYNNIIRVTKHKRKLLVYDLFKITNLNTVIEELKTRTYKHSRYNIFLVSEPKYRIVMSECIKDKLVNHLLSNLYLKTAVYPKLIEENVATRLDKGSDSAIKYCKKYFLRMMNKYDEFYVLKFDIHKYFYSIDHEIVKKMIDDLFVDKDICNMMYNVIDSTDEDYINKEIIKCINREKEKLLKRGKREELCRIEELDKIPLYKKGKGLGIGELTSQVLGIFYLNSVDHYIKEKLHIKEYVRYMDDGIVFLNSKEELIEAWKQIEKEVKKLNLSLNGKSRIYSSSEGFEFVGYRFVENNKRIIIKIKKQTKKRMKNKFKSFGDDVEKLENSKASYKGFFQYCTVKGIYKYLR